ncbi:MAG: PilT protein domain protein [Thermoleophilia bacterium]|nr:PilT protein domain protein [Thermoleophilia bacterium]
MTGDNLAPSGKLTRTLILVSRIVTALLLGVLGFQLGHGSALTEHIPYAETARTYGIFIAIGAIVGWLLGGLVGVFLRRVLARFNTRAADRSGPELVVGTIGLLVGLTASALLSLPLSQLAPVGPYLLLPMTLIVAYVAAELAAAKHREILNLFGIDGSTANAATQKPSQPKVLDTSALIDGRIADIVEAGFLEGELVVPLFVLEQLQAIADAVEPVRRARGRRGLEMVTRLRKAKRVTTTDEAPSENGPAEQPLVGLAIAHEWALVTADIHLAKVAAAHDVTVLNVNRLANAVKVDMVPGERFEVQVVREGKAAGQGVGYLDDGTMVVVEGGSETLGATVEVEVSSVLQSPTGKLVFTRIAEDA